MESDIDFGVGPNDDGDGFNMLGIQASPVTRFNKLITKHFGVTFSSIEVLELHSVGDMFVFDNGREIGSARPMNILGTPKIVINDQISQTNDQGLPLVHPGAGVNTNFWGPCIQYRTNSSGVTKTFLKISIAVPHWTLRDEQCITTRQSVSDKNGSPFSPVMRAAGVPDDLVFIRSCLWDAYAQVLSNFYSIPLVAVSIQAGWHPLILFKNLVVQTDQLGRVTLNTIGR